MYPFPFESNEPKGTKMAASPHPSIKFSEMARREKIVFVLKLAVCIVSFGMIFPNIMND
jgi:hypothetical protein